VQVHKQNTVTQRFVAKKWTFSNICEDPGSEALSAGVQIHLRKKQNYRKIFNGVSSIVWAGAFLDFPSVPVRLECRPGRLEMWILRM
jgi:hypothetical protein